MKISRLEIFGFKSFLERVVLPIDQGITAIVGPNGCGKSNIVDALRWVFGETRASQLRGTHLEDVIFNGTETLRPLGLAEVSLVISTDKASLYEDILNQKRVSEANAKFDSDKIDSAQEGKIHLVENVLNQSHLESDAPEANSGRPRLVVIDGALSQKSNDADLIHKEELAAASFETIESVSNIEQHSLAHNNNAEVPETKEEQDPALTRFAWLKLSREVEVTRRLYRSGESEFFINKVACRLRDLKDLFRLLGLGARSYTLVAQGEVSRIITSKPEERRLMIEEAAGVSGVRERLAAAEKRLEDTKLSLTRLNDLLAEVTRQVNSLRVQATRAKNRAEIKDRLKFLDLSLIGDRLRSYEQRGAFIENEVNQLKERESHSKEQLESLLLTEESIQRELVEFNSRRETISQQLKRGRTELAAQQAQRGALEAEAKSIEQQLQSKFSQFEEISQRAEISNEQLENAKHELEQFTESIAVLQSKMNVLEKSTSEELHLASLALESARNASAAAQAAFQEARSNSQAIKARMAGLDEQLNIQSQSFSSAASILKPDSEVSMKMKEALASLSPLLSHVHAPDQYRKALEVAIAHCADLQICEDVPAFVAKLLQCGDLQLASASLKVVGLPKSKHLESKNQTLIKQPRLLTMLEITEGYSQLFDQLLGDVFICDSIEQALTCIEQAGENKAIFVTLTGELVSSDSFALFRESSGPVEQFARRRELVKEVESCEQILIEANEEKDRLQIALMESEQQHSEALQHSIESEQEIRKLTSELGALRGKEEVISRLVAQLTDEKSLLDSSLSGWQLEKSSLSERLEELKEMMQIASDGDSLPIDQETIDQLEEQLDEINSRGKEVIDSLEERSRARDLARSAYEDLTALRSRAEFEFEKMILERQASEARLHDLYPEEVITSLLTQPVLTEEEQNTYTEEAERLRTRIQREGEVDPESIALFEQEELRLNDLKTQKSDLETAEQTLAETVLQLSELARKRFLETFKIVQANFARLIPRVFGGGFGSLQLENIEDPFEGGIEVSVRPPGKKPKSIELLSGGERALCAIAMIFSMFLHKPSPLCVLDEVDAPLDEANLKRYLVMVREMSSVTQFLMISHNKESMAAADRLVGVTQEQPGASQVVTVSLEQAQAAVA